MFWINESVLCHDYVLTIIIILNCFFLVTCGCCGQRSCDPVVDKLAVPHSGLDVSVGEAVLLLELLIPGLGDHRGGDGGHHLGVLPLDPREVHPPLLPLLTCGQDRVRGLQDITQ